MKESFLFSLFLFLASSSTTYSDKVSSVTKFQTESCNDRQRPGLICMTCDVLATCVKRNNMWEAIPVESCDGEKGLFCNVNDGGCSARAGPCNPLGQEGTFTCNTPGVFPDPYQCQSYHMCYQNGNNMVSINMDCENSAFSPTTGDCSGSLLDPACHEEQWNCTTIGETNVWPGNDNIFYVCHVDVQNGNRVMSPALYRCPADEVFMHGECRAKQSVGPGEPGNTNYKCTSPGLFRDENNCRFYYFCNGNLVAQHIQCPTGTFFQTSSSSCIRGSC